MDQRGTLNVVELLSDLAARDIRLWSEPNDGGQLRYRARKEALTAQTIGILKEHKSDIVSWLGERETVQSGRQTGYSLSQGQLGLWLDWCLDPSGSRYHLLSVDRLPADASIGTLRQAAQILLDRHPVLRTVYCAATDGTETQPQQVVLTAQEIHIAIVDGSCWTEAQIDAWIDETADRPFDLCAGPVMRMTVLRTVDRGGLVEHLLHWTIHHIATDYFTQQILRQELANAYMALRRGEPEQIGTSASDSELTFHDFVRWEDDVLRAGREQLSAFWRSYLEGSGLGLEFPLRPQRPANGARTGKRIAFLFSSELTAELRAFARSQQTTLYAVLLTAYQVVIHLYTQQDDFLIVSPTSVRALPGWSNTVGYFVNPLLVRADLTGNPSFADLLRRTHDSHNRVLQHQMYPYPEVIRHLQKQATVAQLSEAMAGFVLVSRRYPGHEGNLFQPISSQQRGMPQALTLTILDNGDELNGFIAYDSNRFDDSAIERMAGHFQTSLAGAISDPEQPIGRLPLLTQCERRQLLFDWNNTARLYREDKCLHNLFEEQVARTPGATALVFEGLHWTYAELNARANQLAHRLQELGVGPDTLVGICLERSLEMIAGLLGILKAGGAFVPLDPAYPQERLAFMLEDSAVFVLLTQEHLRSTIPLDGLIEKPVVVCLNSDWQAISKHRDDNPLRRPQPGHLAYAMYTSGSTGRPKGVLVEHRAVRNLVEAQMKIFDVTDNDRVLQFASISFDAAIFEISVALCSGAALYLATTEALTPGAPLEGFIARHGISFIWLTPSVLAALPAGASDRLNALRVVTVGGEVCRGELVKEWARGRRFVNLYGPTETTIYATTSDCDVSMAAPPIGVPIDNVLLYIVDKHGQPVPIGIAGELWIGGDCLARGYLNQPQLTGERFISNPFGEGRLYRTGDLVCWRQDGNVEFIRRMDEQVKIRGFRVELGEIETVLRLQPAVQNAAVLARADERGSHGLVTYVAASVSIDAAELRNFLVTKLPGYMVPSSFVFLKDLPLTSTGKLDRNALAALDVSALAQSNTFAPPRTKTEHALADIWRAVLNLRQVGIHESFFELGGHSLLGTQVISRIRQTLAVDVPLRMLFEAPTIATLAVRLEQETAQPEQSSIPLADRGGRLPLSYAQERLWFLDRLDSERNVYNVPAVLRLLGNLDVTALERSLQEIVRRHESLRTIFPMVDGEPIQFIQPEAFSLLQLDLSELNGKARKAEMDRLVFIEANHIFDLTRGPLIRASMAKFADAGPADREYFLIVNLHHIVTDGWSMGVFHGELAALYTAFSQGQPSPLRDLPLQYADFAAWQRSWLANGTMATQLAYWKERLSGAPPLLTLPTDRPRPAIQTHHGAHYFFEFPAALGGRLRALSAGANATSFMTLLAAFQVLLMRYSGQTDIVVGSPIANRNHSEIEPLIGFLVNNLILRSDLSGDMTFLELLTRVKETTLDAYRNQDVPFGKVVEHLQPERDLSHSPLFNVMFDLSTGAASTLDLPAASVENVYEIEFPVAKFDLTVSILEPTERNGETNLKGHIEYKTDLFDRTTIERMAAHFHVLLEGIAANPNRSIYALPLIGEAERVSMLDRTRAAFFEPGQGKCFHHLFEEQVERTPYAPAVVFDPGEGGMTTTLTYNELNRRANQLAGYLTTLGVGGSMGAETLVGLCVERSPEMIVALLAILKAGGAYVPLDPAYPPDRLAFMLADSQAPLILTSRKLVAALPPSTADLVCLDELALEHRPTENPPYADDGRPLGLHDLYIRLYWQTEGCTH